MTASSKHIYNVQKQAQVASIFITGLKESHVSRTHFNTRFTWYLCTIKWLRYFIPHHVSNTVVASWLLCLHVEGVTSHYHRHLWWVWQLCPCTLGYPACGDRQVLSWHAVMLVHTMTTTFMTWTSSCWSQWALEIASVKNSFKPVSNSHTITQIFLL